MTGSTKPTVSITSFGILFVSLLLSCAGVEEKKEDMVRIGAILPLTGDLASFGEEMKKTLDLAVREINESGGILNRKAEIYPCDDGTSAEGAKRCFDIMVSKGIRFVIGPATSSAIIKGLCEEATGNKCEHVRKNKVLIISPSATSPLISELDDGGYIWRTPPSDALQGKVLAQYVFETGVSMVSVIYRDDPYGSKLAEAFKKEFTQNLTGHILAEVSYPELMTEKFTEKIKALYERGDPEGIVIISFADDGIGILRDLNTYTKENNKPTPRLFGVDGNKDINISAIGKTIEFVKGMSGTAPKPPVGDPDYDKFADAFEKAYRTKPGVFTEFIYDAFYVMALGIEAADEYNPEKVKNLLVGLTSSGEIVKPPVAGGNWKEIVEKAKKGADIDFKGVSGELDFDENGDIKGGVYEIWLIVNTEGRTTDFKEIKTIHIR